MQVEILMLALLLTVLQRVFDCCLRRLARLQGSTDLQVMEDEAHTDARIDNAGAVNTNKYYAVRRGYHPGLYRSWHECEREVKGFKNSEFRSFKEIGEAERYLRSI